MLRHEELLLLLHLHELLLTHPLLLLLLLQLLRLERLLLLHLLLHLLLYELLLGKSLPLGLFSLSLLEFAALLLLQLSAAAFLLFTCSHKCSLLIFILFEHASLFVDIYIRSRCYRRRRLYCSSGWTRRKIRRGSIVHEIWWFLCTYLVT